MTSPTITKKPIKLIEEIVEQPDDRKTWAALIMKHTEELGLKKSVKLIKEMQKRNSNESPTKWSRFQADPDEQKNPEEGLKKIRNMVKDVNFILTAAI